MTRRKNATTTTPTRVNTLVEKIEDTWAVEVQATLARARAHLARKQKRLEEEEEKKQMISEKERKEKEVVEEKEQAQTREPTKEEQAEAPPPLPQQQQEQEKAQPMYPPTLPSPLILAPSSFLRSPLDVPKPSLSGGLPLSSSSSSSLLRDPLAPPLLLPRKKLLPSL